MFDAATSSAVMTPTRDTPQQTERLLALKICKVTGMRQTCPELACVPLFAGRMTAQRQVKEGEETLQDHVTWLQRMEPLKAWQLSARLIV